MQKLLLAVTAKEQSIFTCDLSFQFKNFIRIKTYIVFRGALYRCCNIWNKETIILKLQEHLFCAPHVGKRKRKFANYKYKGKIRIYFCIIYSWYFLVKINKQELMNSYFCFQDYFYMNYRKIPIPLYEDWYTVFINNISQENQFMSAEPSSSS